MKSIVDPNLPIYSNNFVTCYSDYFTINLYYFPFGKKKILYKNIRTCDLYSTDDLDIFDYKLWGMTLSPIWWHCDFKRMGRKYYILLDANQWPSIGITMNDNDIAYVYNLIKQKMNENCAVILEKPIQEKKISS
ncbi:hypothetical protein I4U23_017376 [Adineta vaga]|nr:hypothetical protein I4U23_017376 [Adineta vaga]